MCCLASTLNATPAQLQADDTHRRTPLVQAIENCQFSVVNLRGQKTITETAAPTSAASGDQVRHVNGMGTGVVIDPRGYILTNFHVVEDVKEIVVSTTDRQTSAARLIARDPATDLASIKVDGLTGLQTVKMGTSSDLLLAETVAAVGNAYGYEHTVTTGIISHLKRTVQINDNQVYEDLIQTDASINPGNSGGPLLNLDGEMIGVNVAVRVGAQGIAFAIPVNDAVNVAARLLGEANELQVHSGLTVTTRYENHQPSLFVSSVEPSSPAAQAGLQVGDQIAELNGLPVSRGLDWQRTLLEAAPGDVVNVGLRRDTAVTVRLTLAAPKVNAYERLAWEGLGLKFTLASEAELQGKHPNYQRGLRVVDVRPQSPAAKEGIRVGDVLVAMHGWKTESFDNLAYILEQPELKQNKHFMFYILRDREPYFGQMRMSNDSTRDWK